MRNLDDFLESDRQWRRIERIEHAQYMRRTATDPDERTFWRLVLKANGVFDPPNEQAMWPCPYNFLGKPMRPAVGYRKGGSDGPI